MNSSYEHGVNLPLLHFSRAQGIDENTATVHIGMGMEMEMEMEMAVLDYVPAVP